MGEKQITFKLSAERLKQLSKEAEQKGQTIAGFVRQVIYEHLDNK